MSATASPRVSVVIPTWNRATLVMETIESVRRQTMDDWELLLADDGSTDETRALVGALDDPRIRALWLPHSGNPGVPRNAALRAARGEWVAFHDSDDLWRPEKLAVQLAALASHPACGWSYTGFALIAGDGSPLPERAGAVHRAVSGWILPQLLDFTATPCGQATMVRRELLDRVGGFDETLPLRADYDLLLRLAAASEVIAIPDVLTLVRQHPGRTTSQRRAAELHGLNERVFRKAARAAAAAGDARARGLATRQCATQLAAMATAQAGDGDARSGVRSLWRAVLAAPASATVWRAAAHVGLQALRQAVSRVTGK